MKTFIKLFTLTVLIIVLNSLFFEYCINRPCNTYIQYIGSTVMLIITVAFLVYLVKELLKILKT